MFKLMKCSWPGVSNSF